MSRLSEDLVVSGKGNKGKTQRSAQARVAARALLPTQSKADTLPTQPKSQQQAASRPAAWSAASSHLFDTPARNAASDDDEVYLSFDDWFAIFCSDRQQDPTNFDRPAMRAAFELFLEAAGPPPSGRLAKTAPMAQAFAIIDELSLQSEYNKLLRRGSAVDSKPPPPAQFTPVFADGASYMQGIQKRFPSGSPEFTAFVGFMNDYQKKAITEDETVRRVTELFKNEPDLLEGFSLFIPSKPTVSSAPVSSQAKPASNNAPKLASQPAAAAAQPQTKQPPSALFHEHEVAAPAVPSMSNAAASKASLANDQEARVESAKGFQLALERDAVVPASEKKLLLPGTLLPSTNVSVSQAEALAFVHDADAATNEAVIAAVKQEYAAYAQADRKRANISAQKAAKEERRQRNLAAAGPVPLGKKKALPALTLRVIDVRPELADNSVVYLAPACMKALRLIRGDTIFLTNALGHRKCMVVMPDETLTATIDAVAMNQVARFNLHVAIGAPLAIARADAIPIATSVVLEEINALGQRVRHTNATRELVRARYFLPYFETSHRPITVDDELLIAPAPSSDASAGSSVCRFRVLELYTPEISRAGARSCIIDPETTIRLSTDHSGSVQYRARHESHLTTRALARSRVYEEEGERFDVLLGAKKDEQHCRAGVLQLLRDELTGVYLVICFRGPRVEDLHFHGHTTLLDYETLADAKAVFMLRYLELTGGQWHQRHDVIDAATIGENAFADAAKKATAEWIDLTAKAAPSAEALYDTTLVASSSASSAAPNAAAEKARSELNAKRAAVLPMPLLSGAAFPSQQAEQASVDAAASPAAATASQESAQGTAALLDDLAILRARLREAHEQIALATAQAAALEKSNAVLKESVKVGDEAYMTLRREHEQLQTRYSDLQWSVGVEASLKHTKRQDAVRQLCFQCSAQLAIVNEFENGAGFPEGPVSHKEREANLNAVLAASNSKPKPKPKPVVGPLDPLSSNKLVDANARGAAKAPVPSGERPKLQQADRSLGELASAASAAASSSASRLPFSVEMSVTHESDSDDEEAGRARITGVPNAEELDFEYEDENGDDAWGEDAASDWSEDGAAAAAQPQDEHDSELDAEIVEGEPEEPGETREGL